MNTPTRQIEPDFRLLFESSPGLYIVLDPQLIVVAVSDAYAAATLTKRAEIIGRHMFDIFPDNPDDPTATGVRNLRISLENVLKTGAADSMAVQKYDIRRPASEGGGFEERFWSPRNNPIFDANGKLTYIIHQAEDVTDFIRLKQKDVEHQKVTEYLQEGKEKAEAEIFLRAQQIQETHRELARAHEKLQENERLKDIFFANISHELRTPLTLILGPLESLLARDETTRDSATRALLESMHRNAVRLLHMLSELLDFSKLEAKKFEVKREPTPLRALTQALFFDCQAMMQQREIEGIFECSAAEQIVNLDRYLYERILFNLISNAIKFTPPKGRITVALQYTEDRIHISVKDTGIGIAPADLTHLFERFRQGEGSSTRRYEGTGIGLALALELAHLLEGTIEVRSEIQVGSEFVFSCKAPLVTNTASTITREVKTERRPAPPPKAEVSTQPPLAKTPNASKILIAEDNVELALYIASLLNGECETKIASDGEAAFALLPSYDPDLILSDVMMPKLDGIGLCKAIRAHPTFRTKPIILLTAQTHHEALLRGFEAGADEYLSKPFHPHELVTRVRSMLKLVTMRKQFENEEEKRRELEDFTYIASHDLREPVRVVTTCSQVLRERYAGELSSQALRWVEFIAERAVDMQRMLDDLMVYATAGREQNPSDTKVTYQVDSAAALDHVLERIAPLIKASAATITRTNLPVVAINPNQLEQLYTHLLDNALKYRSATAPHLHISAVAENDGWLFSVRDNGIGIEQSYQRRIFFIFERLHDKSRYPGSGLGLAICKRIVQQYGGKIWAESELGKGTTIYFTLPKQTSDLESRRSLSTQL
jgi:signal transduction histidine kinase